MTHFTRIIELESKLTGLTVAAQELSKINKAYDEKLVAAYARIGELEAIDLPKLATMPNEIDEIGGSGE